MEQAKSILLSKTFWFNLIAGIVAAATYLDADLLTTVGVDPEFQPGLLKLIGTIVALGNILLRFNTNKPVNFPPVKKITPVVLFFVLISLSGCTGTSKAISFTKKAQDYLEKHCPKSYVTNPLTGKLEIHYECDKLWESKGLNESCSKLNICIDVVSGSITGDVECAGLINGLKPKVSGKK